MSGYGPHAANSPAKHFSDPSQLTPPDEIQKVTEPICGLSAAEAALRLAVEGYNELPRKRERTVLRIALELFKEPMFGLLIGAGAIYFALGDLQEAILLLIFATISVAIAIVQESRSEKVLKALQNLASPRALVIRDGRRQRVPGRDVVRGDFIELVEGDRVPADGCLHTSSDLLIDESLLTGESVPVSKVAGPVVQSAKPGGDGLPSVFSGSLVVRGHGVAEVTATGLRSEMGRIGTTLQTIEDVPPRLTQQTRQLVRIAAAGGFGVSIAAVLLFGIFRGDWLEALLGGIAIGMAMLPEEFPLVLTVFMVMGARRISKARVLTRRSAAIETLGSATVLCTDKTGTLTENHMTVVELRSGGHIYRPAAVKNEALPENFSSLVEAGVLASAINPSDPMEQAFHSLERTTRSARHSPHDGRTLVHSWGLRPELLAITQIWLSTRDNTHVVAAKGAPEAVARLCGFDSFMVGRLRQEVDVMAAEGMRVLAVARTTLSEPSWPATPTDLTFTFLGLVGLADPLRAEVPKAVAECQAAGIRVVMITGDYPATAVAIARQAGLASTAAMTGDEIENLAEANQAVTLRKTSVFARVLPTQKLHIVRALKAAGEVVAMTGDGVNDAPALKSADIGISMGGRGTDVAREASSIVLLDDNFASIVKTIRLGRRIYDNLRKAMGYIVAVHVPIAGLALLPLVFGTPIILAPIHIAFLEMVIDPVCSVVFEAEPDERNLMRRPPRSPRSALLPLGLIVWNLAQGSLALLLVIAIYFLGIYRGMPETELRALSFAALLLTNVGLILVNRSFSSSLWSAISRRNPMLWAVMGLALPLLLAAITWTPAEQLFQFGPLHLDDLAVCLGTTAILVAVLELLKHLWKTGLVT
ncbi:MAG: cation-translocating P-type ATPase [Rhodospirillaceae bacterium]|nr:MAG: cation-translocating P-type ATPase [Rhodospirillaceae bacterium]